MSEYAAPKTRVLTEEGSEGARVRGQRRTAAEWRDELWSFLNGPTIVAKMKAVSQPEFHRRRPAAEAIAEDLYGAYRADVKRDDVKQLIGRLIKQVMEGEGYEIAERGVRCRPNPVFSTASSYKPEG